LPRNSNLGGSSVNEQSGFQPTDEPAAFRRLVGFSAGVLYGLRLDSQHLTSRRPISAIKVWSAPILTDSTFPIMLNQERVIAMPKKSKSTRGFPQEFREKAVRLVNECGQPIHDVAKHLGCSAESIRRWTEEGFGDIDKSLTIGNNSSHWMELLPEKSSTDTLPMTGPEIREAVINILSDIAPDEDFSAIKDDVPFSEQFEMDSMDLLDIVLELRKRYRIQIPEEDYPKLSNMNSTVEYLSPLMQ